MRESFPKCRFCKTTMVLSANRSIWRCLACGGVRSVENVASGPEVPSLIRQEQTIDFEKPELEPNDS